MKCSKSLYGLLVKFAICGITKYASFSSYTYMPLQLFRIVRRSKIYLKSSRSSCDNINLVPHVSCAPSSFVLYCCMCIIFGHIVKMLKFLRSRILLAASHFTLCFPNLAMKGEFKQLAFLNIGSQSHYLILLQIIQINPK